MKKPIKINEINAPKIEAVLTDVQKLARVRTIEIKDIKESIKFIEKRLTQLMYKKDWNGLRFECDPNAQSFPASYKGAPESTVFHVEYKSGAWQLTVCQRAYTKNLPIYPIGLSTKIDAISKFLSEAKNF